MKYQSAYISYCKYEPKIKPEEKKNTETKCWIKKLHFQVIQNKEA